MNPMEDFLDAIRIRHLQHSDSLDDLTSLLHRAFAALGRQGLHCTGVGQNVETTAHRIRRGACFVAEHQGRIIATMTLEHPDLGSECLWYRRSGVASLHQFAVDPWAQGRGCGRALLLWGERWARRQRYAELALETPAGARHLVAFYASQGFRLAGSLQKADKDYRSLVLSKQLGTPHAAHLSPAACNSIACQELKSGAMGDLQLVEQPGRAHIQHQGSGQQKQGGVQSG